MRRRKRGNPYTEKDRCLEIHHGAITTQVIDSATVDMFHIGKDSPMHNTLIFPHQRKDREPHAPAHPEAIVLLSPSTPSPFC